MGCVWRKEMSVFAQSMQTCPLPKALASGVSLKSENKQSFQLYVGRLYEQSTRPLTNKEGFYRAVSQYLGVGALKS